jgi:hypothetical protein
MQNFYGDNQDSATSALHNLHFFTVHFKSLTLTFLELAKIWAYIEELRRNPSIYTMSF